MAQRDEDIKMGCIVGGIVLVVLGIIGLCLWLFPQYRVYSARLAGEAKLRESESGRQVIVQEARAREEAAKMLAGAEVERARGVAEANRIIGDSLKNSPEYLTWLWIEKVADNGNSVIYIPTEGGMPILEAGRGVGQRPTPKPKPDK